MLPEKAEQIATAHAGLIHRVVIACQQPGSVADLDEVLRLTEANGWQALVTAIRRILAGARGTELLHGLDEEDQVIVERILKGMQNPDSLPRVEQADPSMAAPGLAQLIHAAGTGDVGALKIAGDMAAQMQQAGGDMALLSAALRPMINGERDIEKLAPRMTATGEALVQAILNELALLQPH